MFPKVFKYLFQCNIEVEKYIKKKSCQQVNRDGSSVAAFMANSNNSTNFFFKAFKNTFKLQIFPQFKH